MQDDLTTEKESKAHSLQMEREQLEQKNLEANQLYELRMKQMIDWKEDKLKIEEEKINVNTVQEWWKTVAEEMPQLLLERVNKKKKKRNARIKK